MVSGSHGGSGGLPPENFWKICINIISQYVLTYFKKIVV